MTYDQVAVLQRHMLDGLFDRLDLVQLQPRIILDLGCGTGYGVDGLRQRYPQAQIIALDIAASMLAIVRQKYASSPQIWCVCSDAEALPLTASGVDLIVCSATLQWCDLHTVIAGCLRILRPNGVLAFASFGPDTLCEIKNAWRQVDQQTHVHDFIDMHNVGDVLVELGFDAPVLDVERVQLTYADPSRALNDVRQIGSTNAAKNRARGLLGKQQYRALLSALAELQNADGLVPVTYECIYGHAFAPAEPRQFRETDGSVSIPIRNIR